MFIYYNLIHSLLQIIFAIHQKPKISMTKSFLTLGFAIATLIVSMQAKAQDRPSLPPGISAPSLSMPKAAPKPYKEVITDKAKTTKGMLTVHKVDEKYFFEIPPKILGRDILVLNRISKSSVQSPKQQSIFKKPKLRCKS
jgi:hypothetical protein